MHLTKSIAFVFSFCYDLFLINWNFWIESSDHGLINIESLKIKQNYQSHCVKSVRIPSFSGLYFSALGLNIERYGVFSRIRTDYGEIWSIFSYSVRMRENTDQKNFEYGHFSRCVIGTTNSFCYSLFNSLLIHC